MGACIKTHCSMQLRANLLTKRCTNKQERFLLHQGSELAVCGVSLRVEAVVKPGRPQE